MRYSCSIFYYAFALTTVTAAPPNFDDHIRPIFEQSCNNCHNPDKSKGDLDLSTFSAAMRGGSGGKFAEPGDGAGSKLYGVISHTMEPRMPENGDKIGKKEADLIRAWIDAGMLENKSGKPRKKSKPSFSLKMAPSVGKPDGPPPMPKHQLLEPVVTTMHTSVVHDMAASPWAPLVAITGQRQVLLYNSDSLELEAVIPFEYGQPEVLSFHPSGTYLLAGGGVGGKMGTTVTWEVETGKTILRAGKDFDSVLAASLRADLGGVSLGGPGKRVKLWDTGTDEQLISIKKHTDWVTQMAYSPDGVLLASGGRGGGVYVWEAHTGNEFHTLRAHQGSITGTVWRSDSNLLASSSEDGNVIVWEMSQGKQAKKWQAHGGGVLSIDWARDGHLVTSGRDKKVKIWKPDFSLLKELPAFSSIVVEVSFSHDGKRLFCADWTGEISVWDVASAQQVGNIAANPPTVARTIKMIQQQITDLPANIKAAEEKVKTTQQALDKAEQHLQQTEAKHRELTTRKNQLAKEQATQKAMVETLQKQVASINVERDQARKAVHQAQEQLKQQAAAIEAARVPVQQQEQMMQQRPSKESLLAKNAKMAREAAEAHPEDPAKQEAANSAKQAHLKYQEETRALQNQLEQARNHLAQLSKQQQAPGDQLAKAKQQLDTSEQRWKQHQQKHKAAREKQTATVKPLADTNHQLGQLDKQLQQAKATLPKAKHTHQEAGTRLKHLQGQTAAQQKRLKRWQSAAINTEAIQLQQEAEKLNHSHEQLMVEFTELANTITGLKDPKQLPKHTKKLKELKQQIDGQAPEVISKHQQARRKKQAYLNSLDQQSLP